MTNCVNESVSSILPLPSHSGSYLVELLKLMKLSFHFHVGDSISALKPGLVVPFAMSYLYLII